MNFLLTPVLMVGLLVSPAAPAGDEARVAPPRCDRHCAVRAEASRDPAERDLERQARKHTAYYRVLVRAQKSAAEQRSGRQFTAQSRTPSPPEAEQ